LRKGKRWLSLLAGGGEKGNNTGRVREGFRGEFQIGHHLALGEGEYVICPHLRSTNDRTLRTNKRQRGARKGGVLGLGGGLPRVINLLG